jgi:RNA-directed DNA polymerase
VLDAWFVQQVAPRLRGRAVLVRYADDAVIIFGSELDALRVAEVLPKRFAKYGLALHPEKTRLVDFRRPDRRAVPSADDGTRRSRPGTFDLLGFTHCWVKSRRGYWWLSKRPPQSGFGALSSASRFGVGSIGTNRSVTNGRRHLKGSCSGTLHISVSPETIRRFTTFYIRAIGLWRKWLSRRSQKAWISIERMKRLLQHYPLPTPRLRTSHVT